MSLGQYPWLRASLPTQTHTRQPIVEKFRAEVFWNTQIWPTFLFSTRPAGRDQWLSNFKVSSGVASVIYARGMIDELLVEIHVWTLLMNSKATIISELSLMVNASYCHSVHAKNH